MSIMHRLSVLIVFVGCFMLGSAACNPTPTPSAGPTPEDAAPTPTVSAGDDSLTEFERLALQNPTPFVRKTDPRTPAQLALAACSRSDGSWACPAIKRPLMASGGNGTAGNCGPACTVPAWFLDFANSSGCASDANSGTSATCTGAGIGPLLHVSQLYSRWGSHSPFLVSSTNVTTFHILSSQPIGSATADPWGAFNPVAPDGMISIVGTLQAVGATCTDGAVTAISRANPGNDWNIAAGTCTYVAGQLAFNSTVAGGSYAWVDSVAAGTATLTPPFAAAGLTTPSNNPSFTTDGASWTAGGGDTIQLYTAPTIYLDAFMPNVGSLSAPGGTSGATWVQGIDFADASGAVSNSIVTIHPAGLFFLSLVRSDAFMVLDTTDGSFEGTTTNYVNNAAANCWFNGSGEFSGSWMNMQGGAAATGTSTNPVFRDRVNLKNDIILHAAAVFGFLQVYNAHDLTGFVLKASAAVEMRASGTPGVLWGSGLVEVEQAAALINRTGGTWAANVITGQLYLTSAGATTGTSYTPGTGAWLSAIALTSANIDAHGGLQEPISGARFTQ